MLDGGDPLPISFDTRSARLPRTSGWERYTRGLLAALRGRDGLALHDLGGSALTPAAILRSDWWEIPRARDKGVLSVFPSYPPAPAFRHPYVYVLHDLTWWRHPEASSAGGRRYHRRLAELAVARTRAIVTISRTVAAEIVDHFGVAPSLVAVVPPGVAAPQPPARPTGRPSERPYLLTVATQEPRKNLERLLSAYERSAAAADVDLVIVGRRGWCSELRPPSGVVLTGAVEDGHLARLYASAIALISPSLYEGFGLPLVEAMLMGTPVVCSDIPAHREVAGAHARFFEPTSVEAIAEAIDRSVGDQPSPGDRAAAAVWARRFDWDRSAATVEELVRVVADGGP